MRQTVTQKSVETTAAIRGAKARLSQCRRQVKWKLAVIMTAHGPPVSRIGRVVLCNEIQFAQLRRAGLIRWNGRSLRAVDPVAKVTGKESVAELLIEQRD